MTTQTKADRKAARTNAVAARRRTATLQGWVDAHRRRAVGLTERRGAAILGR